MFRILCDPSSECTELCLTEITRSGSQIFCVCVYGTAGAVPYTHTHTHTHKIFVNHYQ